MSLPDDDDFWTEDEAVAVLEGSPPSGGAGEIGDIANALLEMTAKGTCLAILISELDEREHAAILPRLVQFLAVVDQIPRAPRRMNKRVGFKVDRTKKSKQKSKRPRRG